MTLFWIIYAVGCIVTVATQGVGFALMRSQAPTRDLMQREIVKLGWPLFLLRSARDVLGHIAVWPIVLTAAVVAFFRTQLPEQRRQHALGPPVDLNRTAIESALESEGYKVIPGIVETDARRFLDTVTSAVDEAAVATGASGYHCAMMLMDLAAMALREQFRRDEIGEDPRVLFMQTAEAARDRHLPVAQR